MNKAEDLKKYYKNVFTCRLCRKIYGSDLIERQMICPECLKKLIQSEKQRKENERKLI